MHLPAIDAIALVYKNKKMDLFINPKKITPSVKGALSPFVTFKDPSGLW